jgi:pyruvate dehydrogenase E2 component (dihydrolipoamide acetyltransferase)
MAIQLKMPKLSDTMEEGVLLKWLKKEGEQIESGDVVAEAESDKATMELEAFDSGILTKIIIPEGGKVPVGGTLAIIAEEGEDIGEIEKAIANESGKPEPGPEIPINDEEIHAAPVPDTTPGDALLTTDSVRIKASPLARKLAEENNINLRKITGSGTGSRIIKRDVEDLISKAGARVPAPTTIAAPILVPISAEDEEQSLSTMRTTIATRMAQIKSTVPHFYLTAKVDMTKAIEFRKGLNEAQDEIKISYNDLVLKAIAITLIKHPMVNGSFAGDKIILHNRVDLGFAVALEEGLITPIVRNAHIKSIGQLAKEVRDLSQKATNRKLLPEDYTGGTFTVSNLGNPDFGIEEFSAIINSPEAAIFAVGAIMQVPVVKEGNIVIGNRMKLTLSCDHRIVDGAVGAVFLRDVKKLLENPYGMAL